MSLYRPEWEGTTTTVVTAILHGDVSQVVHLLDQEEYTLLCLPFQRSLTQIDQTVGEEGSTLEAVGALLAQGGCIVSNIDFVDFRVTTVDHRFSRYFAPEE